MWSIRHTPHYPWNVVHAPLKKTKNKTYLVKHNLLWPNVYKAKEQTKFCQYKQTHFPKIRNIFVRVSLRKCPSPVLGMASFTQLYKISIHKALSSSSAPMQLAQCCVHLMLFKSMPSCTISHKGLLKQKENK